jgi:hypothetical protein
MTEISDAETEEATTIAITKLALYAMKQNS